MLGTILIVILVLMLLGAGDSARLAAQYYRGYATSGVLV